MPFGKRAPKTSKERGDSNISNRRPVLQSKPVLEEKEADSKANNDTKEAKENNNKSNAKIDYRQFSFDVKYEDDLLSIFSKGLLSNASQINTTMNEVRSKCEARRPLSIILITLESLKDECLSAVNYYSHYHIEKANAIDKAKTELALLLVETNDRIAKIHDYISREEKSESSHDHETSDSVKLREALSFGKEGDLFIKAFIQFRVPPEKVIDIIVCIKAQRYIPYNKNTDYSPYFENIDKLIAFTDKLREPGEGIATEDVEHLNALIDDFKNYLTKKKVTSLYYASEVIKQDEKERKEQEALNKKSGKENKAKTQATESSWLQKPENSARIEPERNQLTYSQYKQITNDYIESLKSLPIRKLSFDVDLSELESELNDTEYKTFFVAKIKKYYKEVNEVIQSDYFYEIYDKYYVKLLYLQYYCETMIVEKLSRSERCSETLLKLENEIISKRSIYEKKQPLFEKTYNYWLIYKRLLCRCYKF